MIESNLEKMSERLDFLKIKELIESSISNFIFELDNEQTMLSMIHMIKTDVIRYLKKYDDNVDVKVRKKRLMMQIG
jgi:hypothetical protein